MLPTCGRILHHSNHVLFFLSLCNSSSKPQDDTCCGVLISPNYPNAKNILDCTYVLQTVKSYQDIYPYIIDMNLNNVNMMGQNCTKDQLIIQADISSKEWYRRASTHVLLKTCRASNIITINSST